jgi:hypothetical protein
LSCSGFASSKSVCDACLRAKAHQLPYPQSFSQSTAPLELIFSDVWGPAIDSFGNKKFYVSFIDDFSKFTWIYLLHRKSEVFQFFKEFQSLVERMFNRKILAVQTDWSGEYERINSFFCTIGVSHHVSCPHAHQQNGAAEHKHRHIVEMRLALIANASMPLKFWDQAFLMATHLINCTPTKILDHDTPLHRLLGVTPNYSNLRVFGCACWPNLRPYNTHKLQFRSLRCAFLGYSNLHKGYKCLDISTGHVYISRDVIFDETIFPFAEIHPRTGAHYTNDVLLLPDIPRATSDLPRDNIPTNTYLPVPILLPSCVLQPQRTPEPAPDPLEDTTTPSAGASASGMDPANRVCTDLISATAAATSGTIGLAPSPHQQQPGPRGHTSSSTAPSVAPD